LCFYLKRQHRALELPLHKISKLAEESNIDHFNEVLGRILVPRVVGTESHDKVKEYITAKMRELNWDVELDEFVDDTPIFKQLKFTNIIATLNPKAERFLLIACHYDSKYFEGEEFLGATDSAVPCAMMINLAHVMSTYFEQVKSNNDVSIKLVFFDGEEAFKTWTATDSIYGARHLAAKWENEGFLPRIDMMVLLDLLGAPNPTFYSLFKETESWYGRLVSTEEKLEKASLLQRHQRSGTLRTNNSGYFQPRSVNAGIEDDHIPFLRRKVPILHVIPVPFPEVWHKMDDNLEAVDLLSVENLNKIFRIFVAEYLRLEVE
jgi:glutaminyl-peptide cyclotransferase